MLRRCFKTSLAAFQLGFHDFARGTYAKTSGYTRKIEAQSVCGSIKIRSAGWKNVDAVLFWGFLVFCFLSGFFNRRHGSDRRTRKKRDDGLPPNGAKNDQYNGQLWVEIFGRILISVCWKVYGFVKKTISLYMPAIRQARTLVRNTLTRSQRACLRLYAKARHTEP